MGYFSKSTRVPFKKVSKKSSLVFSTAMHSFKSLEENIQHFIIASSTSYGEKKF